MNKELTPLEAFQYIKSNIHYHEPVCQEDEEKRQEVNRIIETALIELEDLRIFNTVFCLNYKNHEDIKKHFNELGQELKALKIIKKKRVDCLMIVLSQTYIEYNDMCEIEKDKLNQEEYELLKEVLL